jgi:hypothetical protein
MELEKKEPLVDLEKEMLKLPQVECSVIHRFGPGLYIRELHMPADTLAIGHYQRFDHMNIFLKGRITMMNEDKNVELKAPMIFTAPPGQKMGYVHEDVVWLNVYPTEERDIETLENTYLDKNATWKHANKLDRMQRGQKFLDVEDYQKLLTEFGVDESTVRAQSENDADQTDMPVGDYKFLVSKSGIEGKGVFASCAIMPGEGIGPSRINGKRTPLGRYVNHSISPNAKMMGFGKDIYLVATKNISGCHGGFVGEEITINYRNSLKLIGVEKCQQ